MNHQRETVYSRRRRMVLAQPSDVKDYLHDFIAGDETLEKLVSERQKTIGEEGFIETFRRIVLHVTDLLWVEHLTTMDYLRSSVNLRAYGQREPLVEYKKEGLQLFKEMEFSFRQQVTNFIETMTTGAEATVDTVDTTIHLNASHEEVGQFGIERTAEMEPNATSPERVEVDGHKLGRNDPCYCGSGKKYKKCHGV